MEVVYINKLICGRGFRKVFAIFIFLFVIPVCGQSGKKKALTPEDYKLWKYLSAEALSDDGRWVSYRHYNEDEDTLYVRNTGSLKTYRFSKGRQGTFVPAGYFLYTTPDLRLNTLSLRDGQETFKDSISSFEANANHLLYVRGDVLTVEKYNGEIIFSRSGVMAFLMSDDKHMITLIQKDIAGQKVVLVDLRMPEASKVISEPDEGNSFSRITWSERSNAFAFIASKGRHSTIYHYDVASQVTKHFTSSDENFPTKMNIYSAMPMKLSDDGSRVFFKIRQRKEYNVVRKDSDVQVWDAQDKYIYPGIIETERWTQSPKQAMWEPASGRYLEITDVDLPFGASARNNSHAIIFNPQDYEPQTKATADKDVYVMDLESGKKTLMLKKHVGGTYNLLVSPSGKYVTYFKEGHWYVYDIVKNSHNRVSKDIPYPLSIESQMEKDESGFGNPGWTTADQRLILYDEFDIWTVNPDGSDPKRLTDGRRWGIKLRIIPQSKGQRRTYESRIVTSGVYDLNRPLLLNARSTDYSYMGFYQFNPTKGLSRICYEKKRMSSIMQSESGTYVWIEEDVNLPPQIVATKIRQKQKVVFRSNPQHKDFLQAKLELVKYTNSQGKDLNGLLYYPAEYVPGKKHPMVVSIYEKQSDQLHHYRIPSALNSTGFNIANLTAKGYFVLLPDSYHEIGRVGASTVDYVDAAVRSALKQGDIDGNRIGLVGHSFGGYQTAFAISQSKLFACAVAGAATTNFLSSHLSMSKNMETPNFFIVEHGQARMKVSPYEDMDRYLSNSTVMHAGNISTPLLTWTGSQDTQVAASQSMELYMALRRLGKTHIMLVYPGESHELQNRENGRDLTEKLEGWLDYYLNKRSKPFWIYNN